MFWWKLIFSVRICQKPNLCPYWIRDPFWDTEVVCIPNSSFWFGNKVSVVYLAIVCQLISTWTYILWTVLKVLNLLRFMDHVVQQDYGIRRHFVGISDILLFSLGQLVSQALLGCELMTITVLYYFLHIIFISSKLWNCCIALCIYSSFK